MPIVFGPSAQHDRFRVRVGPFPRGVGRHAVAQTLARCDDAIAHGERALDLLAARQPAPGRCPGCGCTIGGGDVICDRCHEQHPGHRPSTDPLGADFLELARSFGD